MREKREKPVLVVMAAGMGSRYGGLKQIDPVGNHGQLLLDYSIYDAKRAGFETVIFVIKREIEQAFHEAIGNRFSGAMLSSMRIRSWTIFRRATASLKGGRSRGERRMRFWRRESWCTGRLQS